MNSTEEIWKDIVGFEGVYQVSNLGNVRRIIFRNKQVTKAQVTRMAPIVKDNGYVYVSLRNKGIRKNHYVHRLVMSAFVGENVDLEVNHIDFNRSNNVLSNLEYCTHKENINYSLNRRPTSTGELYIQRRRGCFCVRITRLHISRQFKSLEDAVVFRNEVLANG